VQRLPQLLQRLLRRRLLVQRRLVPRLQRLRLLGLFRLLVKLLGLLVELPRLLRRRGDQRLFRLLRRR
jgi:hypothetical protein